MTQPNEHSVDYIIILCYNIWVGIVSSQCSVIHRGFSKDNNESCPNAIGLVNRYCGTIFFHPLNTWGCKCKHILKTGSFHFVQLLE